MSPPDVLTTDPKVVCNCAGIAPTMPTYRTHHLPICPVWVVENVANVTGRVTEPITVSTETDLDPVLVLRETRKVFEAAQIAMKHATDELHLTRQHNNWLRGQLALARERTAYPEFCKHPGKCAGTGRCCAEHVCND